MKNKKIKTVLISSLIIAALVLSIVRIYHINQQYPNPKVVNHALNESIRGGDTSLTVQNSELIDGNQLKKLVPEYQEEVINDDGSQLSGEQMRFLLVYIKLTNHTDETQMISLAQINATSLIWTNGIIYDLFVFLNPNKGNPIQIELSPNQEMEVVLPYGLYSLQFKSEDWQNIDNQQFTLVLSRYPTKHIVKLNYQ